ncbi:substrate-binding periplasmic protein [Halobacteriovorax sp.]|uniref:substrate-binding periplasmic protein n=1 Tax=Halobacteriovorax sp. TaxID=2020862 RepID=UPI0035682DE8
MKVILLLCLLILPQVSHSKEIINIATGSFPPYTGQDLKNGGLVLELVTAAFKATGYEVRYHFLPWQRGYRDSSDGHYDATAFYVCTERRKKDFYCSKSEVSRDNFIFFRKKSTKKPKWNKITDLRNLSIGLTLGYFYDHDFLELSKVKERNISLSPVKSDIQNLKKLSSGKIDIFPCDKYVGLYLLREQFNEVEREKITYDDQTVFNETAHVLFPRISANSLKYRAAFDYGMKIISNNGVKDKIIEDSLLGDFN